MEDLIGNKVVDMELTKVLFGIGFFTVVILIAIWLTIKEKEDKNLFVIVFMFGALGWTITFLLRLIPIQLIQSIILAYLGIDFTQTDPAYYESFILSLSGFDLLLINIWGPILAAIFEETGRFQILSRYESIHEHRVAGSLMTGLGWATGELIFIYFIPLINSLSSVQDYTWAWFFTSYFERLIAGFFHIGVTFLVFYAIYEQWPQKMSLWIAMVFHFILNFSIVVFDAIFPTTINQDLGMTLFLELILAVVVIFELIFIFIFWIPNKRGFVQDMRREMETLEEVDF